MAKAMAAKAGGKCTCNMGYMVLAWILMAIGLWALVGGFATQFNSANPQGFSAAILGWYFVGILFMALGKMAKWKGHGTCSVHTNVN